MNATTPIPTASTSSLPPELLVDIFLHLYKEPSVSHAKHDLRNTHKLTSIMLVCKRWKDIVERAPILWTDIRLSRCPPYMGNEDTRRWLDYVKTLFVRSGSLPLNLTIIVAHVNLGEVIQVLLQHLGRCKMLTIRALQNETKLIPDLGGGTSSAIYHILSSPLPTLQTIAIDGFAFELKSEYDWSALELDAPNLRDINTLSPDIIPFVKPDLLLLSVHNLLQRFSISLDWGNIVPHLPRNRLSLPNLKFLSVAYLDCLWDLLRVMDTSNLEHFVIMCGVAEWPEEVNTDIPVMSNLRELEWYTDPDATDEPATLRHLLHHCPNITLLSYICSEATGESLQECLVQGTLGDPILSFPSLLSETGGGSVR
ncbi:hypothetical protein FS837_002322 [Tulasnella sp. UAMH 9824]|nr:hypothetical protein FS837_002322 [Tulasnella sp. UAMH 9824]